MLQFFLLFQSIVQIQSLETVDYFTTILHPHDEPHLADILIQQSQYHLSTHDLNAATFLATHALHMHNSTQATSILTQVTEYIKEAKQTKHRSLDQAVQDAVVLQNVGADAILDVTKAVYRAYRQWDRCVLYFFYVVSEILTNTIPPSLD